jgi:periplasmic copper chaperone A
MNTMAIRSLACVSGALLAAPLFAHNTLTSMYAPAGYVQDLEMRVTHGCKGSPVKEVRVKIPDGVMRVSVANNRDWTVETRMRKLPKPVPGEGGNMITETVDEIVWKNPKTPIPGLGAFEGFKFRGALPNTPGEILFFRTVNVCEKGDDKYIDMPKEAMKANTPGLSDKLWKFMTATSGPAPFLILEKATRPQYPFAPPAEPKRAAAAPAAGTVR